MYIAAGHTIFGSQLPTLLSLRDGSVQFMYRFCPNTQSRCGQTCIPNLELGGALESPSLGIDRDPPFFKEVST